VGQMGADVGGRIMCLLYWFSHRYSSTSPEVKAANLRRACERLDELAPSYRARGIILGRPVEVVR
jgi:hypothetical protein